MDILYLVGTIILVGGVFFFVNIAALKLLLVPTLLVGSTVGWYGYVSDQVPEEWKYLHAVEEARIWATEEIASFLEEHTGYALTASVSGGGDGEEEEPDVAGQILEDFMQMVNIEEDGTRQAPDPEMIKKYTENLKIPDKLKAELDRMQETVDQRDALQADLLQQIEN